MRTSIIAVCATGLLLTGSAFADVDEQLVGTWKFDGVAADMFWVVRGGGDYRLHGWGVPVPQRGRFEGSGGKWSIVAPGWEDSGTYQVADADTWVVTGRYGTGTWKRVWAPGQAQQSGASPGGVCALIAPSELAGLLAGPVGDPEAIGARHQVTGDALKGCRYTSRLNGNDRFEIDIESTLRKRQNAYARAKETVKAPMAVPGLGVDAYAHVTGDTPSVKVLGKNRILTVSLYVVPGSAEHDLPELIEHARLIYGRLD
jgi:hypothetical protein